MLTLKHFVLRSEARKLYRDMLRTLRGIDEDTARGVREHARGQFEDNAHVHDLAQIRSLIVDGRHSLDEMRGCLKTTR